MPDQQPSPRPTVLVLTEEAFGDVDARNLAQLRAAEDDADTVQHLVLVPADTQRSLLADLLDHLSLGELREAVDAVREGQPDPAAARTDAETALAATLAALRAEGLVADGRTTADDPLPELRRVLASGADVRELVVVTRPHAVEDTFHRDWASRARDEFGLPVLHLYAGTSRLG